MEDKIYALVKHLIESKVKEYPEENTVVVSAYVFNKLAKLLTKVEEE